VLTSVLETVPAPAVLMSVPDIVAVVVAFVSLKVNTEGVLTAEEIKLPDTTAVGLKTKDTEFTANVNELPAIVGFKFTVAEPTADDKALLAIVGFTVSCTEFTADVSD